MALDSQQVFGFAMDFLPQAIAAGIKSAEAELASNDDRKAKAVSIATTGLTVLDKLSGHELSSHPAVQAVIGEINDLMVKAARTLTKVHDDAATAAQS